MKKKIKNIILMIFVLVFAVFFVAKFGGPRLLRLYIETGMGDCRKNPIFCVKPVSEIKEPVIDEAYLAKLKIQELPEVRIKVPKEFRVIKQRVTKTFYKKRRDVANNATMYLLYEPKGFFSKLFPNLIKQGVTTDYEFISSIMNATTPSINNLTDAFFTILKGVFTPDLGDQKNVEIVKFSLDGTKGFIGYNLNKKENYFNCDIISKEGDYFKVYIKDKMHLLDLNKVLAIISTLKKSNIPAEPES